MAAASAVQFSSAAACLSEPCGHRLPLIKMSFPGWELLLVVLNGTEVYRIKGFAFARCMATGLLQKQTLPTR